MAEKSKFPWAWVGCGCMAIAAVVLVFVGVVAFFGVRTAQTLSDPVAREDKAEQILSASALPGDYETEFALSIPFYADLVVLQNLDAKFVYLKGLKTKADLKAAFASDESFDKETRRAGIRIGRTQTILARGTLQVGAGEVRYVLVDGDIDFVSSGSRGQSNFNFDDEDIEAEVSAVFLLRCSADETPGIGMWAGARGEGDELAEDPATDHAALIDFIERFEFCR